MVLEHRGNHWQTVTIPVSFVNRGIMFHLKLKDNIRIKIEN